MHIFEIIRNFFTELDPQYSLLLLAKLALAAVLLIAAQRLGRWKFLAFALAFVLCLRIVLFDQPASWKFYADHINGLDIGWRPQDALYVEYYKFFRPVPKKFLAVGSSQSYMIYMDYSKKHSDVTLFNLAGMTPIDMYLYRGYIAARKPKYVLLYLSEFDLAREPELEKAKIAPSQGLRFLDIYPMLRRIADEADKHAALRQMIAGEFFPEIKYNFIFKGLAHKSSAEFKETVLGGRELDENINDWSRRIDSRWIKYQEDFLKRFLAYCRGRSVKVVIVEGQYNPRAYTPKTLAAQKTVRKDLKEMAEEFDAILLPLSKVTPLGPADYSDAVHPKPEAGYHFAERLFKTLETMP
jgi:hypothetical protein